MIDDINGTVTCYKYSYRDLRDEASEKYMHYFEQFLKMGFSAMINNIGDELLMEYRSEKTHGRAGW